ncbi:MAG: NAAT family transporter [Acidobacteriota bacterium]|nr:NAAT family transporter [Acidobacteriota bacterium]
MTLVSAAALLFLVLDPFGNLPFFAAALEPVEPSRHRRVIVRELLIALAVLVAFLLAGRHILAALGISEPALGVAGGTVLLLIAIKMVFPVSRTQPSEDLAGEPFVVPLAIPYVAGPSAMATVLLLSSREPERWREWLAALAIAWLAAGLIIAASSVFARVLGRRGMIAVERLMGMVLVAIAVQMLMDGIARFLQAI